MLPLKPNASHLLPLHREVEPTVESAAMETAIAGAVGIEDQLRTLTNKKYSQNTAVDHTASFRTSSLRAVQAEVLEEQADGALSSSTRIRERIHEIDVHG